MAVHHLPRARHLRCNSLCMCLASLLSQRTEMHLSCLNTLKKTEVTHTLYLHRYTRAIQYGGEGWLS